MSGVFESFYNLIVSFYGVPAGQPESITNANYWLAWSMVTFVLLLVFLLFIFGTFLIVKTLVFKREKKENQVHYYYHKKK